MSSKILGMKKAIITGASSGIGADIAKCFASAGADVWVGGGRNKAALKEVIEHCRKQGVKADGALYNLSKSSEAAKIIHDGADFLGGLDILVNSAGTRDLNHFVEVKDDAIDYLFAVNAKAPFIASREAAKIMLPQKSGHILMIGSDAAEHGTQDFSLYGVTKATMHALTKNLAIELGPAGLRINCLAMGPIKSGRVKKLLETDKNFYETRIKKIPIREFW